VQARFVIEYGYVHLMSCAKKQVDRATKDQLCLLALLTDRLEKVRHFSITLYDVYSSMRKISVVLTSCNVQLLQMRTELVKQNIYLVFSLFSRTVLDHQDASRTKDRGLGLGLEEIWSWSWA